MRLPAKKIQKLDDAFREKKERFKSQIHLIIISRKKDLSSKFT